MQVPSAQCKGCQCLKLAYMDPVWPPHRPHFAGQRVPRPTGAPARSRTMGIMAQLNAHRAWCTPMTRRHRAPATRIASTVWTRPEGGTCIRVSRYAGISAIGLIRHKEVACTPRRVCQHCRVVLPQPARGRWVCKGALTQLGGGTLSCHDHDCRDDGADGLQHADRRRV